MKTFFPRHIDGWRLNISFQIGPFRINMIQLLVVATGIAAALWIWNQMVKRGISKGVALVVVLPIIILFVVIAFFKVSELSLIPFLAKVIQTNILDETKKYQGNLVPIDPAEIAFARSKLNEAETSKLDQKDINIEDLANANASNILK